jgi:hypothetical protein
MKLVARLEDAVQFLRKLIEAECHAVFTSRLEFFGRD